MINPLPLTPVSLPLARTSPSRRGERLLCAFVLAVISLAVRAAEPETPPTPKLPDAPVRYTCGEPTADEQYVLQMINRARSDPKAEGKRLNLDLTEGLEAPEKMRLEAKPPLAMNETLLKTARDHSKDMYDRGYFDHTSPDGKRFMQRIKDSGYAFSAIAENIAAGSKHTPAELQDLLVVDSDTPERGHRCNIFGLHKETLKLREVGVGIYANEKKNTDDLTLLLTQDFGVLGVQAKPILTGVVYADKNANGFYDPGEGLAGVTVKLDDGSAFAITNAAGGWAIPVSPGRYKLSVSGGDFESTATASVKVASDNIELDFISGKSEAVVNFAPNEK